MSVNVCIHFPSAPHLPQPISHLLHIFPNQFPICSTFAPTNFPSAPHLPQPLSHLHHICPNKFPICSTFAPTNFPDPQHSESSRLDLIAYKFRFYSKLEKNGNFTVVYFLIDSPFNTRVCTWWSVQKQERVTTRRGLLPPQSGLCRHLRAEAQLQQAHRGEAVQNRGQGVIFFLTSLRIRKLVSNPDSI